jgi:hypothetical protein
MWCTFLYPKCANSNVLKVTTVMFILQKISCCVYLYSPEYMPSYPVSCSTIVSAIHVLTAFCVRSCLQNSLLASHGHADKEFGS